MRILLVEDDLMIGEAVSVALKDAAYAVDWVKDGATASRVLEKALNIRLCCLIGSSQARWLGGVAPPAPSGRHGAGYCHHRP